MVLSCGEDIISMLMDGHLISHPKRKNRGSTRPPGLGVGEQGLNKRSFSRVREVEDHLEIELTHGYWVKVSTEDYPLLSSRTWYLDMDGYAKSSQGINGKAGVRLHQLLFPDLPDTVLVDHKDRNRLDCRRDNLRVVDKQVSAMNVGLSSRNTSGCKGVSYIPSRGNWKISLRVGNEKKSFQAYRNTREEACELASKIILERNLRMEI